MKVFKAIVAAFSMLAVLTNPVVLAAWPCCCFKSIEPNRVCGSADPDGTGATERSCCAKKQKHACCVEHERQADDRLLPGCCCVEPSPASAVPVERPLKPTVEQQPLIVAVWFDDGFRHAPELGSADHSPGRFLPSGPPLLALYCRWLN